MLASATTFAIDGLDSRRVTVEVDLRQGLPTFAVVGLGDKAVREARERVRAAIQNCGLEFPQRRITANLAPAHLRKVGPGFDLAIACAILAASGQVPVEALERWAVFGELSLGGDLRPCRGTLAVAEGAVASGLRGLLVPATAAAEAALVDGLEVGAAGDLRDVVAVLRGEREPAAPARAAGGATGAPAPDLEDVRGHAEVLRGLAIAAAGGHNLLLSGPPGVGKTMLARRLPSILPPLTHTEALEVTRIHSVAGLTRPVGLVAERPFRAPHHSISASGLVGGGSTPTPGEVSLAQHGVLFLDELSEFARPALEALRQPLEDGRVAIVRGQRVAVYPSRFTLVASTNPCPCGFAGEEERCRCTEADLDRHRRRLSGPLLDRIDLLIHVRRPSGEELARPTGTSSERLRAQVVAARERQGHRLGAHGLRCNAELPAGLLQRGDLVDEEASELLRLAYERHRLSARGHHRVLRVARTIADLDDRPTVSAADVAEALGYRHDAEGGAEAEAA